MYTLEALLKNRNFQNLDDTDSLLKLADWLRDLIKNKNYDCINKLIKYTIDNDYFQAFTWTIDILQEEFDKNEKCTLESFGCEIGRFLKNYDKFVDILKVDFNSIENRVKDMYDSNTEIQSFFNISKYRTSYNNVFLISDENFDTKDNDYIQYKLLFSANVGKK